MTTHTLILLRHGKAEPPTFGASDAARQLAERGRADTRAAGTWLATNNLVPDLVLCSPAVRTRQTWEYVRTGLSAGAAAGPGSEPAVAYVPSLYSEGPEAVLKLVSDMDDEIGTLLVIGHNPTMSIVSAALDPEGGCGTSLPTATLAVHTVPSGAWSDCERGAVPLVTMMTPRDIPRSCRPDGDGPTE